MIIPLSEEDLVDFLLRKELLISKDVSLLLVSSDEEKAIEHRGNPIAGSPSYFIDTVNAQSSVSLMAKEYKRKKYDFKNRFRSFSNDTGLPNTAISESGLCYQSQKPGPQYSSRSVERVQHHLKSYELLQGTPTDKVQNHKSPPDCAATPRKDFKISSLQGLTNYEEEPEDRFTRTTNSSPCENDDASCHKSDVILPFSNSNWVTNVSPTANYDPSKNFVHNYHHLSCHMNPPQACGTAMQFYNPECGFVSQNMYPIPSPHFVPPQQIIYQYPNCQNCGMGEPATNLPPSRTPSSSTINDTSAKSSVLTIRTNQACTQTESSDSSREVANVDLTDSFTQVDPQESKMTQVDLGKEVNVLPVRSLGVNTSEDDIPTLKSSKEKENMMTLDSVIMDNAKNKLVEKASPTPTSGMNICPVKPKLEIKTTESNIPRRAKRDTSFMFKSFMFNES